MATKLKSVWEPTFIDRLPRRERRGCEYEAYVPDSLTGQRFDLRGDVAADVADAESAIRLLNTEATALTGLDGLARLLLRAEAIGSSKIEGLEIGGRRLLHAEVARTLGEPRGDVTAEEVLGNIDAMAWAVEHAADAKGLQPQSLYEVHRRLMAGTRLELQSGKLRDKQNWIGGGDYNPCDANYVPPPPGEVPALIDDLCHFCNQDELPAVAQAAIAHAQFETIHPFVDGNGRVGRALIHIVLRRRGLTPRMLPPVSLVLATLSREYVKRLTETRYVGAPTEPIAKEGWNEWLGFFAAAANRAVAEARLFEDHVVSLKNEWRRRLGHVRAGSAADLLIEALPGAPIVTVKSAADLIGRTFVATNEAVAQLVLASVLRQINVGRRNRAFEATELVDTFNDLERQLASPGGDTRASPPSRRVPSRRIRKSDRA